MRATPKAFGLALLVLAASAAAVASHLAVDVLGDYLLAHDSYDHVAHHSRSYALVCAAALALSCAWIFIAAAVKDARNRSGALRSLVGWSAKRSPWVLIGFVAPATVTMLVGMESLDAWVGRDRLPGFASALGGSIPLGLGVALCAAALSGAVLWRTLRAIAQSHREIAMVFERLVRIRYCANGSRVKTWSVVEPGTSLSRLCALATRAGKRAPPAIA